MRSYGTLCVLLSGLAGDAAAGNWPAGGLLFSDELGGFEILSVRGAGTLGDPIVISQRLSGIGPAILVVRLDPAGDAARQPAHRRGYLKLALVTRTRNDSARVWAGFDLELQEELGQPSVYRDGLSFDQVESFSGRRFGSDRFRRFTDLTEPFDRIRFDDGSVDPGGHVTLNFFVTDVTPRSVFYILQEPKVLTATGPRPSRHAGWSRGGGPVQVAAGMP